MTDKPTQGAKTRQRGKGKELRDSAVRADRLAGMSTIELAAKYGITRQSVSEILNSDETREMLRFAEDEMKRMIGKALERVGVEINDKLNGPTGLKAALAVLKTFGIAQETMKLEHSFPKPVVIDYGDGKREKFTAHREGDEDKDDG